MKSLVIPRFLALVVVCVVCSADDDGRLATCDAENSVDCRPQSWIDEMGKNTEKFLREKVFGQSTMKGTKQQQQQQQKQHFLSHVTEEEISEKKTDENPFMKLLDRLASDATSASPKEKAGDEMVGFLIEKSKELIQEEQGNIDGLEFLSMIQNAISEAAKQLKSTFGNIIGDIDPSIAISVLYYMASEDEKKNPTWKRRQHRFFDTVSKSLVLELHDALYLSQLAYSNSLDDFRKGLEKFQDNSWELVFGTTESTPTMPSHFLLIHKNNAPLKDPVMSSLLPWESLNDNEIEVTLVIRGTKHLSDIISDALLEPAEYMGGYAHSGILASGKELANKYSTKLKELLEHSGRNKIRLYIVGHSLGAGAGAVCAKELHGLDYMTVEAVGFGCPSLLSEELSLSTKDYITTVITDADIIPRMSGSSAMNQLLDLLEFNWADAVLDDMKFSLERIRDVLPFGDFLSKMDTVKEFSKDFITKEIKPKLGNKKYERVNNVLIPPGKCIHFFRDGVGFTGTFTPCSFFRETDLVRTLIDDHLVIPGYHRALVTFMRDKENDYNHYRKMIATMIQLMIKYLMGETLYSKELQALAMALQGALAVRRGPNKDSTMHPFHAFALSTVIAFAGGWFGFFWMGKPTPMITNGDLNIMACMIAFTVVNYTPFDIGYKVVNFLPIKLVITSFGQLFRCLGMIRFITTAFNEVPASPYYSIPVLGPVLYGTLLGNWGGFFLKGFNGCLENGIPWPFQNGIVMGLFFHLFAHDVDGPLGNILRSTVYALVPRQFEDDRTFALIITGIFMQVTGVLMLPQFLGPSFSVFLTPVTSLTKVYSKITPFPPPRDVDNTKPSSSTYTPPPITEKKAEDTTISTRAGKRKNKRKNKKKTA